MENRHTQPNNTLYNNSLLHNQPNYLSNNIGLINNPYFVNKLSNTLNLNDDSEKINSVLALNSSLIINEKDDSSNLKDETILNQEKQKRYEKAKSFPIPINDLEVKIMLRDLMQPIIMFGESLADRRHRLSKTVTEAILNGIDVKKPAEYIDAYMAKVCNEGDKVNNDFLNRDSDIKNLSNYKNLENELFYTEAIYPNELIDFRTKSINASFEYYNNKTLRAKEFIESKPNRVKEAILFQEEIDKMKYELVYTEFTDERGTTYCSLDKTDNYIATSGVSGLCSVYKLDKNNIDKSDTYKNIESLDIDLDLGLDYSSVINDKIQLVTNLNGHTDKVNCIKFNHNELKSSYAPHIATCSDDTTIKLWTFDINLKSQKSTTLNGHQARVNKVEYTKINHYLGSVSHDKSIRIWDLINKKEILLQEGHCSPVYCLSFSNSSEIMASGDLNGIGMLWDLRSGKKICNIEGHTTKMFSINFSRNDVNLNNKIQKNNVVSFNSDFYITSGGDDNLIRLWDIRNLNKSIKDIHTKSKLTLKKDDLCLIDSNMIPAHNKLVSSLDYCSSDLTISGGYDGVVRVWNSRNWDLVSSLKVDDCRVNCVIGTKDRKYIFSANSNRTLRVWKNVGL